MVRGVVTGLNAAIGQKYLYLVRNALYLRRNYVIGLRLGLSIACRGIGD